MSQPQRYATPTLPRQATYGQRPVGQRPVGQRPYAQPVARPTQAGVRLQPGVVPAQQRPLTAAPGHPTSAQPAPRAAVTFLTVAEVAAIMRVSKMTVYRLVHGGEMAAVRVGRSFRVPEPAVRTYLAGARTDVA